MKKNLTFLFLLFLIALGHFLYVVLKVPDEKEGSVTFEVQRGQNVDNVIKTMSENGILNNPRYFKTLTILTGRDNKIKAGSYTIPYSTSVYRLLKILTESNGSFHVSVTVPEGYNLKMTSERLARAVEREVVLSDLIAKNFKKKFDVVSDLSDSSGLEGYLFPDTYYMNKYDSDAELAERMIENLQTKAGDMLRSEQRKQGISIHDFLTMASLIEKEIPSTRLEERKIASGVLWKRLKEGMPLQVDATIVYLTGKSSGPVTFDDLKIVSPYNTYLNQGLPPGPIASPGLSAIEAALYPTNSPYWYYISKGDGETVFSKTLEEHNTAINKYLR